MKEKWAEAPNSVIDLAQEIIRKFHSDLREARIGFLMRTEPSMSQGRRVLGKAEKVSEKLKLLLDLDFLIWLDEETWGTAETERQRALIDHLLCHCLWEDEKASMRGHDVEEFSQIVKRYGAWNADLMDFSRYFDQGQTEQLVQDGEKLVTQLSMLPPRGGVVSVDVQLAQGIEEP